MEGLNTILYSIKEISNTILDSINNVLSSINNVIWGSVMLFLLMGTHIFLTVRLNFIQKYTFKAIKLSIKKDEKASGDISPFEALMTALSATLGTGNIVGVATAVAMGGPGAVFWIWVTGIVGMATKYSEALVAVKYRVKTSDGTMLGGPMYALENGLNMKWLGLLFAIFTSLAAFGIGNATQAKAISVMMETQFNISPVLTGIVISVTIFLVIIGGVKAIAKFNEKLVPYTALFYVAGCIFISVRNFSYLGGAISLILRSAFSPNAVAGGFVGSAVLQSMRYGIARGLFSNESGLGSAPIAAAAAQTRNPVRQSLISMTGVFWDTVIVCAITGITLVSSMIKYPQFIGLEGAELTSAVFGQIPVVGSAFLAISLFTFAYTTILGWSYYGERAAEYIFGKIILFPYRLIWSLFAFIGSIVPLAIVWEISDLLNALMAFPNLISLVLLSGVIVSETRKYLWNDNLDGFSQDKIREVSKTKVKRLVKR